MDSPVKGHEIIKLKELLAMKQVKAIERQNQKADCHTHEAC